MFLKKNLIQSKNWPSMLAFTTPLVIQRSNPLSSATQFKVPVLFKNCSRSFDPELSSTRKTSTAHRIRCSRKLYPCASICRPDCLRVSYMLSSCVARLIKNLAMPLKIVLALTTAVCLSIASTAAASPRIEDPVRGQCMKSPSTSL